MRKTMLLLAAGAGYVLGAKAGRERYEQIRGGFNTVKQNPKVQAGAHQAADLAKEKAPVVKEKVTEAAGAAAEKVKPGGGSHSSSAGGTSDRDDLVEQLNPESTARQEDPYPKGDLP